jgi:hypothetical protein
VFSVDTEPSGCEVRFSNYQGMLIFDVSIHLHVNSCIAFVTSHFTHLQIPELDFEIPPEAQRGKCSTVCFIPCENRFLSSKYFFLLLACLFFYLVNQVEGIIMRAVDELQALQDERKVNLGTLYA